MCAIGTDHHRTKYFEYSRELFSRSFLEAHPFTEGKGAVRDRKGAYFIDREGNPTSPERYRHTYPYENGLAAVEDDLGMFHMDSEGKPIYTRRFSWVSKFREDLCAARYRNGTYTFIDRSGNPWEQTFRYCSDFSEGFGIILDDNGFTFISKDGKHPFDAHYEECRPFDHGLASVKKNGKWQIVDKGGNAVTGEMDFINESNNGLFTGIKDNTFHYLTEGRNWSPLFTMQTVPDPKLIPSWTDDILDSDWDSCVVFMRHSERRSFFICNSMDPSLAGLTPNGDELARNIGKKISALKDRKTVKAYCSDSIRCVTTANCIMGAMGVQAKVDISTEIGNEGTAFIKDSNYVLEDLICPGTVWMERGLKGDMIRNWYPPEISMKNLYDLVSRLLTEKDTLTFCVNHDLFLVPTIAAITGRFPQNRWVDYCEGCLFVKKGDRISMIYNGKEYPFGPVTEIDIDSSPTPSDISMDLEKPENTKSWMFAPTENNAWIGKESEGICTGCDKQGRFFHGRSDEFCICSKTFSFARDFTEQCAPIYIEGKGASYISDFGDYLHNRWFLDTRCYREGLSAARSENGWNYIDVDGKTVIGKDFDEAYDFLHGEALVFINGKAAVTDREGKITEL